MWLRGLAGVGGERVVHLMIAPGQSGGEGAVERRIFWGGAVNAVRV